MKNKAEGDFLDIPNGEEEMKKGIQIMLQDMIISVDQEMMDMITEEMEDTRETTGGGSKSPQYISK